MTDRPNWIKILEETLGVDMKQQQTQQQQQTRLTSLFSKYLRLNSRN